MGSALNGSIPGADVFGDSAMCGQETNRDNLYLAYYLKNDDTGTTVRHIDVFQIAP